MLPVPLNSDYTIPSQGAVKLQNSVQEFRLLFRSPDWVKQNGNVLVYIIIFARNDREESDTNKLILTDEAALGNLNAYLSNHTYFCKNFKDKLEENNQAKELKLDDIDCQEEEPESQKYSTKESNKRLLRTPEKCYFERDPDKCGLRMVSYRNGWLDRTCM